MWELHSHGPKVLLAVPDHIHVRRREELSERELTFPRIPKAPPLPRLFLSLWPDADDDEAYLDEESPKRRKPRPWRDPGRWSSFAFGCAVFIALQFLVG